MSGKIKGAFCDASPDSFLRIGKIISGDGFHILVLQGKDEECVRARLTGSDDPMRLYSEDQLREIEKDERNPLADAALYARMAVIRTKSKMGFLQKGYAIRVAVKSENKIALCDGRTDDPEIITDTHDPNGHFKDYVQGRSVAAREDKWRGREKVPMGRESRFDLDYDS